MYRASTNVLPSPLQEVFYRTRRGNFPVRYSTNIKMSKNVSHAGPKIWKNLPNDCKQAITDKEFKKKTKAFLLNK